jgi:hypothetical protein
MPYHYITTIDGSVVVQVEATQLTKENVKEVAAWCNGQEVLEHDALDSSKTFVGLNLDTAMGRRRASEGDFIILHPTGEFYVHKSGTFNALYQKED